MNRRCESDGGRKENQVAVVDACMEVCVMYVYGQCQRIASNHGDKLPSDGRARYAETQNSLKIKMGCHATIWHLSLESTAVANKSSSTEIG